MNSLVFQLKLAGPVSTSFVPASPIQQCQATDQGIPLVIQVLDGSSNPVNLRLASSMEILVVRPSGVRISSVASFFTNGIDGQMAIVSNASVPGGTGLDEPGTWQIQGKVKISGNTQFTLVGSFLIYSNLGA